MLFYLTQNPLKHLVNRFFRKTVPEILTDGREMRKLTVHQITEKPAVRHIHLDLFTGAAQRRDAVKMLNENDLEQYDRIDARSDVVMTIQISGNLIDFAKSKASSIFRSR